MGLRDLLYGAYERRLAAALDPSADPAPRRRHRSTATGAGPGPPARRPRRATRPAPTRSQELLGWCEEVGVEVVTLWLLSTDNLSRPAAELDAAAARSSRTPSTDLAAERPLAAQPGRRARPAARPRPRGRSRTPPTPTRRRRRPARQRRRRLRRPPRDRRRRALAAAGARRAAAPRSRSWPRSLDVEHIAEHLYTKGQPDPDLVIRTSGEQRLSASCSGRARTVGVLLLRGVLARLPHVDFLRALRAYADARPPLRRLSRAPRHARSAA